ncbi:DUF6268 family outer membrane beta-barrel protein [Fulvivirgaceae bacterium BMA10]|uniref:DUF6268 family outer membrane beta-barrel protein n=1 Tax=Splendidivirga corallicola TaxID=3051826 RepID=A0ABT8KL92_9BACT|nr:DUF6268 family outer membrane beta-barrel protein [Fulvivirgaceae bacterium BMA10]
MNQRSSLFFCIIFFVLCQTSFSQNYVDIFRFSYEHYGTTELVNNDLKQRAYNLIFNLPIVLNEKGDGDVFQVSGNLNLHQIDHSVELPNLWANELALSYRKFWGKDYKISSIVRVSGSINSDYQEFPLDHFQYNAALLIHYQWNKELKFGVILFHENTLFVDRTVPLFLINWKPSDQFVISAILLSQLHIGYQLNDRWYFGSDVKSLSNAFALNNWNGLESSYFTQFPVSFPYRFYIASLFAHYTMHGRWGAFVQPGFTFRRNLEHYALPDDQFLNGSTLSEDLSQVLNIKLGITYRVWLNKK